MTVAAVVAGLALAIWLYLLAFRGGFWRLREIDAAGLAEPTVWPAVAAVIPARNEADMVPACIGSLLAQEYPGRLTVVLVDDQSEDGTGEVARSLPGAAERLTVLTGTAPPQGWTGKLWAVEHGVAHVSAQATPPPYVLLTDADIAYERDVLRGMVARAEAGRLVLTSLMVKLRCESLAERALIPAFVFFFRMLYPFAWINRPEHPLGGAAGGSMLVDRQALARAGGVGAIRNALIDDCTLGALLKRQGPVWLGLTQRVHSLRPYPAFNDIRRMVARSAYAQLRYSPWLLAGTVVGLVLTYLAAPVIALTGDDLARGLAIGAWCAMAIAYLPMVRFYGLSPLWAPLLPAIAAVYAGFTMDSAIQHWMGRGGMWKGRAQAHLDDHLQE